jgi:hypothetical protein
LNYIKFFNLPEYPQAMRAMHGLLTLLDIIPISYSPGNLAQIKQDFGIAADNVQFHGYWDQTAVQASREDVKVSYYRRNTSALIVVMNLGQEPFFGQIMLDWKTLGLDAESATIRDAESKAIHLVQRGGVMLRVPRHDFRLLRVDVVGGSGP